MKSFELQGPTIESSSLVDRAVPELGTESVLVRMRAVSLNYRDLMVAEGRYGRYPKRPLVPCSDGVGVVEEVGAGVTRWKPGDRVAGIFMQTWLDGPLTQEKGKSALGGSIDGVLQELVAFNESGLVSVPAHLSDTEAACLPCAGVTAWNALFEASSTVPGDVVLLQGTGGVSIFALLFAKAAGLKTILTSSSDEKIARAKELGANETINYKQTPEWDDAARKLTGGLGVDQIIEVGGSGTFPLSLKAARTGGKISVIGILSGTEASASPANILASGLNVQGIYVGSRYMFERMNRAISLHRIKPVVDRVFGWTEYQEALRYMKSASHFGKICLQF